MPSGLVVSVTDGSVFSGFSVPGGTNQDSEKSCPSVTVISTGQVSSGNLRPGRDKRGTKRGQAVEGHLVNSGNLEHFLKGKTYTFTFKIQDF